MGSIGNSKTKEGSHDEATNSHVDSQCGRSFLWTPRVGQRTSRGRGMQPANRLRSCAQSGGTLGGTRSGDRRSAWGNRSPQNGTRRTSETPGAIDGYRQRSVAAIRHRRPSDGDQFASDGRVAGNAAAQKSCARPRHHGPLGAGGWPTSGRGAGRTGSAVRQGGRNALHRRNFFLGE